jgi:hypothetical protein
MFLSIILRDREIPALPGWCAADSNRSVLSCEHIEGGRPENEPTGALVYVSLRDRWWIDAGKSVPLPVDDLPLVKPDLRTSEVRVSGNERTVEATSATVLSCVK